MSNPKRNATKREVTTTIDTDRCIGCGTCTSVCPKETISIVDGKAVITGSESMACDHCAAVCPSQAIQVGAVQPLSSVFHSFCMDIRWLPFGRYDTMDLVNLMASRRSCRNFSNRPVNRMLLTDLANVGITAPSGSNCQPWTFTILPDREALDGLGRRVGNFFRKINKMAEKRWLRWVLRWMGKPGLDKYYKRHYHTVEKGLIAWERDGQDLLFHGATAAIVVAADKQASCPSEDAILATGNMLLAAHAMGLGTCLVGFVIEAMKKDRSIVRMLGIPDHETPYAVIALGWPEETYQRVAGRKPATIRFSGCGVDRQP